MENKEILLSICIPTYNRCEYLDKTIASIVKDPLFSNGVELVISDNCSDDNTQQIVLKYQVQFDNIIYHRNEENIRDANFVKVLELGHGVFLKLYNDTAIFLENTIAFLLDTIQNNLNRKPVLCFPNAALRHNVIQQKECNSFEEFVDVISFYSTWIASFGIWKTDFYDLTDIYRGIPLQLWQTDILFRLVAKKNDVIIYNIKLVDIQPLQKKGGYNIFDIFANNYLSLYDEYLNRNQISAFGFRREKRRLFQYFFIGWMKTLLGQSDIYSFERNKGFKILFKHYKCFPIFYLGLIYLGVYKCYLFCKRPIK